MNELRKRIRSVLERLEELNQTFESLKRELAELQELEEELLELQEGDPWEDINVFEGACLLCGGDHDTHEHLELEVTGKLN